MIEEAVRLYHRASSKTVYDRESCKTVYHRASCKAVYDRGSCKTVYHRANLCLFVCVCRLPPELNRCFSLLSSPTQPATVHCQLHVSAVAVIMRQSCLWLASPSELSLSSSTFQFIELTSNSSPPSFSNIRGIPAGPL